MKYNWIKKSLPYVMAVLIFMALSIVYMLPQTEGKKLKQSDITQFKGMSKEIVDYREATGEEPYWTNSMFGGMPAYQISTKYEGNIAKTLDPIVRFFIDRPAGTMFLYMLGFFILLLALKVRAEVALVSSIAYGLTSYLFIILGAGHNSKATAISLMAPVLAGVFLTLRKKYLLGGVVTALFLALQIWANHVQMTYYLGIMILVILLVYFIYSFKEKEVNSFFKSVGVLFAAAIVAVACNFTSLYATYSYSKETIRGKSDLVVEGKQQTGLDKEYATTWSYGIGETFTLLIPDFNGGVSNGALSEDSKSYSALIQNGVPAHQAKQVIKNMPLYWGTQPGVAGPIYVGAIVIFLFVLGCFVVKGKIKHILLILTILSILLSWGSNFSFLTDFFFDYVPMYNKFRAVSMTLVIAELTIPLLAGLALWNIVKGDYPKEKLNRYLYISFGIVGGIALFFALFSGGLFSFVSSNDIHLKNIFPDWLISALTEDRQHLLKSDAWRSFIYVALSFGVIWLFVNKKIKSQALIPALALLIIFDLWFVDKRYLNKDNFVRKSVVDEPFQPSEADKTILQDKDLYYRVFNQTVSPFNDASTSYFHKSVGGYHAAKLRRYQDVIEHHLSKGNISVFNMLNTKWFILPDSRSNQPVAHYNPEALGNAWFVQNVKMVDNANQEIEALNDIDVATTLVYDKAFDNIVKSLPINYDSTANIKLVSYAPNKLVYECSTPVDACAVFSDIYYANGWNAQIDGNDVPYFRANYILRALNIPKGEHTIVFTFEPQEIKVGTIVSYTGSAILLLSIVLSVFVYVRKYKSEKNKPVTD
ncbi:MAG: YfhO family protein [Bacteroidales bacterium]|jgi:hypothetical protein